MIPISQNVSAAIGQGDMYRYTFTSSQQTVYYSLENIYTNSSVIAYRESYWTQSINKTSNILTFDRYTRQSLDSPDYYLWAWISSASPTIRAGIYILTLSGFTSQYYIYTYVDYENGSKGTYYYDRTTLVLDHAIEYYTIDNNETVSSKLLTYSGFDSKLLLPTLPPAARESPVVQEARDYLTTLNETLQSGISSPEILNSISELFSYSTNPAIIQKKDVSEQVDAELHLLQTLIEIELQFSMHQYPSNPMPTTIYPNEAFWDCGVTGTGIAQADADCPDPAEGPGYGSTLTDSGFTWPVSDAWATSSLWFQTMINQNVPATVTFNGHLTYAWVAFAFWHWFSDCSGHIQASAYVYDATTDIWNLNQFVYEETDLGFWGMFGHGSDNFDFYPYIPNYYFHAWHEYCIGTTIQSESQAIKLARCKFQSEWELDSMDFDPVS